MTPSAPIINPLDFTDQYNTPLAPAQQPAYEAWARANGQDPIGGKYDYDLQGAFLSKTGNAGDPRGHFTDQFKKPNHPTFSDQSQYNGLDGYVGGKWTKSGYQPSTTNIQFHPRPELQNYFDTTEPDTALLQPQPTPKPTGRNGQYRISDFRVKPPARPMATIQTKPRRLFGQQY